MEILGLNIDAIGVISFLVMPGYIIHSIYSRFVHDENEFSLNVFLRYFTYSLVSNGLTIAIYWPLISKNEANLKFVHYYILFVTTLFVFPVIFGLVAGIVGNKMLIFRLLRWCKLKPMMSILSAWDTKFSEVNGTRWVAITLDDGSVIAGLMDQHSSISSTSKERDIYLTQSYYLILKEAKWIPKPNSDGVLVRGQHIKSIEFWFTECSDEIESEVKNNGEKAS